MSRPFLSFSRTLPGRLIQILLLLAVHFLLRELREILAPGFPSSPALLPTILGVFLETIGAGLTLWLALDFRFETARLIPRALDRRFLEGLLAGPAIGALFFGSLFLLDALFPLPERGIAGISYWRQGLLVPAVEEFYFRFLLTGVLLQRGWAMKWAIPFTALIFALSHDYFVAPFLFPVGLAAGWVFGRYGAWSSFLMHATYNLLIIARALH